MITNNWWNKDTKYTCPRKQHKPYYSLKTSSRTITLNLRDPLELSDNFRREKWNACRRYPVTRRQDHVKRWYAITIIISISYRGELTWYKLEYFGSLIKSFSQIQSYIAFTLFYCTLSYDKHSWETEVSVTREGLFQFSCVCFVWCLTND